MKITGTKIRPYDLPLRQSWVMAGGCFSHRSGWIVSLFSDGKEGLGDCPAIVPGHSALDASREELEALERRLCGLSWDDAFALLQGPGSAAAAFEAALWDLKSQILGAPLRRVLEKKAEDFLLVNDVQPLFAFERRTGFSVIKIKVGARPPEEEIAALRQLPLQGGARLRLDANGAWDFDQAARFLAALENAPIEALEEPLKAPTIKNLERLQAGTPIALAVDENLSALGVDALLESRAARRIILKLGAVGGLERSLALGVKAVEKGIECVVTSRLESGIGLAAAQHLATALDARSGRLMRHGLGTGGWLARDLCDGAAAVGERIALGERPGLGLVGRVFPAAAKSS